MFFNKSLIHKFAGEQTKELIKSSFEYQEKKAKSSTYKLFLKKWNGITVNPDKFQEIHCNKATDSNLDFKGIYYLANGFTTSSFLITALYYTRIPKNIWILHPKDTQ